MAAFVMVLSATVNMVSVRPQCLDIYSNSVLDVSLTFFEK